MATGITKNKWENQTSIILDEIFDTSFDYEISYKGKIPKKKLITAKAKEKYTEVFENYSDNKLYYGDNLDVLKHLIHNTKLQGKVKLIYIDPPYGTNSVFYSRNQKSSYKDDLIGSHFIEFLRELKILEDL